MNQLPTPQQLPWTGEARVPLYFYHVDAPWDELLRLEALLPGLKVWGKACNYRGQPAGRLRRVARLKDEQPGGLPLVSLPPQIQTMGQELLKSWNVSAPATTFDNIPEDWNYLNEVGGSSFLEEAGRDRYQQAKDAGLFVQERYEPMPWQYKLWGARKDSPSDLLNWAAGSGKTVGATVHAALNGGPTLIICPGKARPAWENQAPQWISNSVYRHIPKSDQRVGWPSLEEYLAALKLSYGVPRVDPAWRNLGLWYNADQSVRVVDLADVVQQRVGAYTDTQFHGYGGELDRLGIVKNMSNLDSLIYWTSDPDSSMSQWIAHCAAEMKIPFQMMTPKPSTEPWVILGLESIYLPEAMEIATSQPWRNIIFDEIHLMSNHKRWSRELQQDGSYDFNPKMSASEKYVRVAKCLYDVTCQSSIRHRIGMTAEDLVDGKHRALWAQWDLLQPGSCGGYWDAWVPRYCYNSEEPLDPWSGAPKDDGSSNAQELRERAKHFVHTVPYEESHGGLPRTRIEVVYLEPEEQGKQGAFKSEISALEKLLGQEEAGTFSSSVLMAALEGDEQAIEQLPGILQKRIADFDPMGLDDTRGLSYSLLQESLNADACYRKLPYIQHKLLDGARTPGYRGFCFVNRRAIADDWGERLFKEAARLEKKDGFDNHPGIVVKWAHGGHPDVEREQMVADFADLSDERSIILVGTGQAFGTSVDGLQVADYAAFAAFPYAVGIFWKQWLRRLDRLGGRPSLAEILIARGTSDEKMVGKFIDQLQKMRKYRDTGEWDGVADQLSGFTGRDGELCDLTLAALGF